MADCCGSMSFWGLRAVMLALVLVLFVSPIGFAETSMQRTGIDCDFGKPWIVHSSDPPNIDNVSPQCLQDLLSLLSNAEELILALDSFGKPTPGMLVGNLAWLGHFDECMDITEFRYCLVDLGVNLTTITNSTPVSLAVQWGVCAPESCSEAEINDSLEILLQYLNITWLTVSDLYGSAVHCNDKPNTDFNGGFIGTCVLFGLLTLLSLCGSLVDYCLQATLQSAHPSSAAECTRNGGHVIFERSRNDVKGLYTDLEVKDDSENQQGVHPSLGTSEKTPLLAAGGSSSSSPSSPSSPQGESVIQSQEPGAFVRFLLCFAITRNLPKLLSAKQAEGGIPCLNGIRVISISWVILGHTLAMVASAGVNENLGIVFPKWLNSFAFQAIGNAFFSVDSFFFLSGLLLTFLTLKKLKKTGGKLSWIWFYVHRYIRLTPALAVLILIIMFILPNLGQGPVWFRSRGSVGVCRSWWWTDLLYINNFIPNGLQDCVVWAWYLANDMQFFLLSPLIILPLFWYPIIGCAALVTTCIASFITSAVLMHKYDFLPGAFQSLISFFQPSGADQFVTGEDFTGMIYIKPYCRIPPYLVGMALGYVMYRIGTRKIKMSPVITAAGWAVASALGIAVVYGLYDVNRGASVPTQAASMAYTSLSTFTWGVALSWVVFACHYGYGGVINNFLSWSFWIPLSRMTYSTYLLHPVIMQLYGFSLAVPMHWSAITMSYMFVSFLTLAYVCSMLMNVLVEFPFGNMEKMLQQALQKSKAEKRVTGRSASQ